MGKKNFFIYIFSQKFKINLKKLLNFTAYRNQPAVFKEGANSAFHEGMILKLLILMKKHNKMILIHKKKLLVTLSLYQYCHGNILKI